jgi:hypothetical protein
MRPLRTARIAGYGRFADVASGPSSVDDVNGRHHPFAFSAIGNRRRYS